MVAQILGRLQHGNRRQKTWDAHPCLQITSKHGVFRVYGQGLGGRDTRKGGHSFASSRGVGGSITRNVGAYVKAMRVLT